MSSDHYRITDPCVPLHYGAAERMVEDILSSSINDDDYHGGHGGILAVCIMDRKGNFLSAKSKESFEERFGGAVKALQDRDGGGGNIGGILSIATLAVVNEVKDIFGEAQAITTVHTDCKLMLLTIPLYDIMVGLVLERWSSADADRIAKDIQTLLKKEDQGEGWTAATTTTTTTNLDMDDDT
ncbi:MAG: hypothetical protein M3247_01540 [Thermoproteota archaeon]|nr:hypothetical protein [Thermoproteota archaeon]